MTIISSAMATVGNAAEVVIAGHPGIGAEGGHKALPFLTVGLYPVQAVNAVHDVVGDLVRDGAGEALVKVLGENPRVVADLAASTADSEHTRAAADQVESHFHGGKCSIEDVPAPGGIILGQGNNLCSLGLIDGLNHDVDNT